MALTNERDIMVEMHNSLKQDFIRMRKMHEIANAHVECPKCGGLGHDANRTEFAKPLGPCLSCSRTGVHPAPLTEFYDEQ
jgi:hypothetical protein